MSEKKQKKGKAEEVKKGIIDVPQILTELKEIFPLVER